MNQVNLTGRLVRDPSISVYEGDKKVARFSIAIGRGRKDGNDLGADYINIVAFGKAAELIEKWFSKGKMIGITGHIHTDQYEKDGRKIYTTDVVMDAFDFLSPKEEKKEEEPESQISGFSQIDDDFPF